jgi:hypothetical protein
MALEYTLTETISPDEYKNSFVNFYRQVLGMGGTYGDEGGGGGGGDTFTPQQTVMSYRDDDEKQPTNFDALDIKVLDAGSIAALPSLDFDKMKEDRLKLFEVPEGASIMERIEKRGPEVASKAVGSLPSFVGGVSVGSALTGGALSALVGGSTGKSAFNKPMYRPSGFLGVLGDQMAKSQEKKLQAIAAHQAAGVGGDSGFAMTIGNLGIVRGPGESTYTGNRQGLSHKQIKNIEALSKGILPETYRFDRDDDGGDAIFTGGKKINQSIGQDGGVLIDPNDPKKGFYRGDGAIYSLKFGYSPVGMMSDVEKLGKNYFPDLDSRTATNLALQAITDARKGNGTVASNISKASEKASTTIKVSQAPTTGSTSMDTIQQSIQNKKDKDKDDPVQRYADSDAGRQAEKEAQDEGLNQGGFVQRLAPGGGVAATASGFVDGVPPSQATDGQEVADDKDGKLPEGAYVINASAVTFAGETDIINMLRDAQKEAVRRGITAESPQSSSMIDVAVSRGEVVVSPHLVNIIGKDRLEKINNRGIKDTERKIQENGQQVQGAATGGDLAEIASAEPTGYEYREGMSSLEAGVARILGVFGDVNKSIQVSQDFRDDMKTEDDIEDTLRHILLGGLTASTEDDNFFTKGQRGIAKFLIDDIREGNYEYKPESAIDLNNNKYGRALRQQFPKKEQFTRAAMGAALMLQAGEPQEIDGLLPQLSTTGR